MSDRSPLARHVLDRREAQNLVKWRVPVREDAGDTSSIEGKREKDTEIQGNTQSQRKDTYAERLKKPPPSQKTHAQETTQRPIPFPVQVNHPNAKNTNTESHRSREADDNDKIQDVNASLSPLQSADELVRQRCHWNFLLDGFHRLADELYFMTEYDGNIDRCKECVQVFHLYAQDFQLLFERLQLQQQYSLESKPIAWEVKRFATSPRWKDGAPATGTGSSVSQPQWSPGDDFSSDLYVPAESPVSQDTSRTRSISPPPQRVSLHEKLMSPDRKKKTPQEIQRIQEEKQEKARQIREQIECQRGDRYRETVSKQQRANERLEEKRVKKRLDIDEKLDKAEQLHEQHLQTIIRKAENENSKVDEVAFITTLSLENKRLALMARLEESEQRRQQQLEEWKQRQKRDEILFQERRKILEELKRQDQEAEAKHTQARKKAEKAEKPPKIRKEPISKPVSVPVIKAAVEPTPTTPDEVFSSPTTPEQKRKIQFTSPPTSHLNPAATASTLTQSPSESKERAADEKAIAMIIEQNDLPVCKLCDVQINSVSDWKLHNLEKKHILAVEAAMVQSPEECLVPLKVLKDIPVFEPSTVVSSKLKQEINQKMSIIASKFQKDQESAEAWQKSKICRILRDINVEVSKNRDSIHIEKLIHELGRFLEEKDKDVASLRYTDGFHTLFRVTTSPAVSKKVAIMCAKIILAACSVWENRACLLMINIIPSMIGYVQDHLKDDDVVPHYLVHIISSVCCTPWTKEDHIQMRCLLTSHSIHAGVVHRIRDIFHPQSQKPVSLNIPTVKYYLMLIDAITCFYRPLEGDTLLVFDETVKTILECLRETNLAGVTSVLTCNLLQSGPPRHTNTAPPLSPTTKENAVVIMRFLNNIASFNMSFFQDTLGSAALRMEVFHVISMLLQYSCENLEQPLSRELLHELILAIGYFSLDNPSNQQILQWGKKPTMLQRLCTLPFEYFIDARQREILLPTLISACNGNSQNCRIVQTELNPVILAKYLQTYSLTPSTPHRFQLTYRIPSPRWTTIAEALSNPQEYSHLPTPISDEQN